MLRSLPAVEEILQDVQIKELLRKESRHLVVECVREAISELREKIKQGELFAENSLKSLVITQTQKMLIKKSRYNLQSVINATGVILHTNLGRAVLSQKARAAVAQIAGSYSNLELDLTTGERGSRYSHVLQLLRDLTGCEDALVVNNNAAAILLVLASMAKGKEVIVSRGQLIEIGGSFRVPEVMEQSGAKLVEIGTTNKTYLEDYERAINSETAALLKVHTSNYRVVGFTHETSTEELVKLGREKNIPVIEDAGSGVLFDLKNYGIQGEPIVQELISTGVDIVTFSGDKLLGGPQAGIIVGNKSIISQVKKYPLTRALRVDKMTVAALEATLKEYLDPQGVVENNPALNMLTMPLAKLQTKAERLKHLLAAALPDAEITIEEGYSQAGGGALPTTNLPTFLVAVHLANLSAEKAAHRLHTGEQPVLVRINQNKIILDPRTILPGEEQLLVSAFQGLTVAKI
ncbi:L-seryl-tRNA(Sec) selenium transferase [Bacillota bacterium LX-D]|nr:L-seryl-tRNA(Sec) selenium transferase [Bacillota bacterium LX-D]